MMKVFELLKGRRAIVLTDAKVSVELEIQSVTESKHSEDLKPATEANDWWPKSREWTTYVVLFTNGFRKSYDNLNDLELVS
jgi:hypothetical protein